MCLACSSRSWWFWVCFWTPFWSFWTQLLKMIMGSLLNVLLKLLNTASEDDFGFASERPSEASEHSFWRWLWVRFWTSFWTQLLKMILGSLLNALLKLLNIASELLSERSELTFWSSELVSEFNVLWFLVSWYDLNLVPVLVKHSRAQVKYQWINQSPLIL